jgi:hypothetical protein
MLLADIDSALGHNGLLLVLLLSILFTVIVIVVVSVLTVNWRMLRESEHASALKRSMIERGMSADDIERVVRAVPVRPDPVFGTLDVAGSSKKTTDDLNEIANALVQAGVPGKELEQILDFVRASDGSVRQDCVSTVANMIENDADAEQILASLRAIYPARAGERPGQSRFTDEPASFRQS